MGVQIIAAVLAWRLLRITGKSWAWVLLSLALVTMALRRGLALVLPSSLDPCAYATDLLTEYVALITSFLMMIAIIKIAPLFFSIQQNRDDLQASERKYRLLVSNIPALVFQGYTDWTVDFMDDKVEKLTGYEKLEFQSRRKKWSDLILPEDLEAAQKIFTQALDNKQPYAREYRIKRKNGEILWIRELSQIICGKRGEVEYINGLLFDITPSKEMEAALHLKEQQFVQAQRMEAIGRLAGGIAHDFNNLLTPILGYSDDLLQQGGESHPWAPDLQEIKKAGEKAAVLTRQLLSFSRQHIPQPEIVDLNTVVMELEKMLRRLLSADIHLITALESDLGKVYLDRGLLEQVVMNLAVNARDAMPSGGKLIIKTDNVLLNDPTDANRIGLPAGSYVLLNVTDSGTGIDEDTQRFIFEPFFTTKAQDKGTGLGLSTVYWIVQLSGGHIRVRSTPGKGTTFKIFFPQADSTMAASTPTHLVEEPQRGWETILLVEDNELVAYVTHRLLEKSGYRVLTARNGSEALRLLEQTREVIMLMLTDIELPDFSGLELAQRLNAKWPQLKVLFMSGHTENELFLDGVSHREIHFLPKPFQHAALARKVREVLNQPKLPSEIWAAEFQSDQSSGQEKG